MGNINELGGKPPMEPGRQNGSPVIPLDKRLGGSYSAFIEGAREARRPFDPDADNYGRMTDEEIRRVIPTHKPERRRIRHE